MEQKRVGIVLGVTFIIIGLMLQPSQASEAAAIEHDQPKITHFDHSVAAGGDGREDAMCTALYASVLDQLMKNIQDGIDVDKNTAGLEYYALLQRIVHWEQVRIRMNAAAYTHQVEFYLSKMDTALALLHYDRCWHRVNVIYADYKKDKLNNNQ